MVKRSKQNYFLILLAFFVIVASLFIIFSFSSNSSSVASNSANLMDTSSWATSTCVNLTFKVPTDYIANCSEANKTVVFYPKDRTSGNPDASMSITTYDGVSPRQQYISNLSPTQEDLDKYIRFEETRYGKVDGLAVYTDASWWQGGYASPIMIAHNKQLLYVNSAGNFNSETGEITKNSLAASIASTVKFK